MGQVAVIGAGSAGLAAAQALKERGLEFTVFEAGSGVGGNWRYDNDSGLGSTYASLRANTSRFRTSYRCFPLPRRGPLFLHHTEMLAYLEAFTDHFGLRPHIRFSTKVTAARPEPDGGWTVETADGAERFDAVLVAAGYNSIPRYPELPGRFDGLQMHTHDYRTPEPFAGLDVVVMGLGCSAAELACEVARVARSVTLATRSGCAVVPRRLGPLPIDLGDTRSSARMPWRLRRHLMRGMVRVAAGDQVRAGLPAGPRPFGSKPFTVSDEVIASVRSGRIEVSPAVVELRDDRVVLADGSERRAEAILYGTGYEMRFPFLAAEVEAPTGERVALYRGVASPAVPGLFFIGVVAGHGALIPMFEAQANWVADVLARRLTLPSEEVMRESIARDDEVRRRYFDPRFGYLWDRVAYANSLDRESRRARRRPGVSSRAAAATVPG